MRQGERLRIDVQSWDCGLGKVSLHADRAISVHGDIPGLRRTSNVLAKVEAGNGDGPFRHPMGHLLIAGVLLRIWEFCGWSRERHRFARRQKSPTPRIPESKIEVRHGHSAIGIPGA